MDFNHYYVLILILFTGNWHTLSAQDQKPFAFLLVSSDLEVKINVNDDKKDYLVQAGGGIIRIPVEKGENALIITPTDGGSDYYTEVVRIEQPENKVLFINLAEKRKIAAQAETARQAVIEKQIEAQRNTMKLLGIIDADMVLVKGGVFRMGCTYSGYKSCFLEETPARQVTLSDFYLNKYEVTQKQWRAVMGSNPSYFKDCENENCPVENVSWNEIQDFLAKLNAVNSGKPFRLPTEAEWEYAARGGKRSRGYEFAGGNDISKVAWADNVSYGQSHPVGGKKPNELGLFDMSGNIGEWCNDWFGSYPARDQSNPTGTEMGDKRVWRGGSYYNNSADCRPGKRNSDLPDYKNQHIGFRLARSF